MVPGKTRVILGIPRAALSIPRNSLGAPRMAFSWSSERVFPETGVIPRLLKTLQWEAQMILQRGCDVALSLAGTSQLIEGGLGTFADCFYLTGTAVCTQVSVSLPFRNERSSSRNMTSCDLRYAKPRFSEQLLERLPELMGTREIFIYPALFY